jgi:imidazolonepropionase-like amidohydrolase
MPALAALQSATMTNAEMLGRDKQLGQLAAGFEADLLVVERNPLESPGTLQDPLLVISNGRVALDRLNFARAPAQRPTTSGGPGTDVR